MKITKQRLRQIIKEEVEAEMGGEDTPDVDLIDLFSDDADEVFSGEVSLQEIDLTPDQIGYLAGFTLGTGSVAIGVPLFFAMKDKLRGLKKSIEDMKKLRAAEKKAKQLEAQFTKQEEEIAAKIQQALEDPNVSSALDEYLDELDAYRTRVLPDAPRPMPRWIARHARPGTGRDVNKKARIAALRKFKAAIEKRLGNRWLDRYSGYEAGDRGVDITQPHRPPEKRLTPRQRARQAAGLESYLKPFQRNASAYLTAAEKRKQRRGES